MLLQAATFLHRKRILCTAEEARMIEASGEHNHDDPFDVRRIKMGVIDEMSSTRKRAIGQHEQQASSFESLIKRMRIAYEECKHEEAPTLVPFQPQLPPTVMDKCHHTPPRRLASAELSYPFLSARRSPGDTWIDDLLLQFGSADEEDNFTEQEVDDTILFPSLGDIDTDVCFQSFVSPAASNNHHGKVLDDSNNSAPPLVARLKPRSNKTGVVAAPASTTTIAAIVPTIGPADFSRRSEFLLECSSNHSSTTVSLASTDDAVGFVAQCGRSVVALGQDTSYHQRSYDDSIQGPVQQEDTFTGTLSPTRCFVPILPKRIDSCGSLLSFGSTGAVTANSYNHVELERASAAGGRSTSWPNSLEEQEEHAGISSPLTPRAVTPCRPIPRRGPGQRINTLLDHPLVITPTLSTKPAEPTDRRLQTQPSSAPYEQVDSKEPALVTLTSFPFRIVSVNEAFIALTGRHDLVGRSFFDSIARRGAAPLSLAKSPDTLLDVFNKGIVQVATKNNYINAHHESLSMGPIPCLVDVVTGIESSSGDICNFTVRLHPLQQTHNNKDDMTMVMASTNVTTIKY